MKVNAVLKELVRPVAGQSKICFEEAYQSRLPGLCADESALRTLLSRILEICAQRASRNACVETRLDDECLLIEISHDGEHEPDITLVSVAALMPFLGPLVRDGMDLTVHAEPGWSEVFSLAFPRR